MPKKTKEQRRAEKAAARARADRAAYAETDKAVREYARPVVPASAAELAELRAMFPLTPPTKGNRP